MKQVSDEELIKTYLNEGDYAQTARKLGLSRQWVQSKLQRLRNAGVDLPFSTFHYNTDRAILNANRIAELNAFIHKKGVEAPHERTTL